MKYLCLISAETLIDQINDDDATKHFAEYREFTDHLRESGHYVGGHRLLPPTAVVTLRVRDGKVLVTDGPYAETKEQLGGFIVLEARNIEEAIQVASRIPGAKLGCVEVRPIAEDAQTRHALENI